MKLNIGPQPEEDRTRRETIDGINYVLKASDPYGFWSITCLKNNRALNGVYTTLSEALKAAKSYSAELNKIKKDA